MDRGMSMDDLRTGMAQAIDELDAALALPEHDLPPRARHLVWTARSRVLAAVQAAANRPSDDDDDRMES